MFHAMAVRVGASVTRPVRWLASGLVAISFAGACAGTGPTAPKTADGQVRLGLFPQTLTWPPGFFRGTPTMAQLDVRAAGTNVDSSSPATDRLEVEGVREYGRDGPCEQGDARCFGATSQLEIELSMCDSVNLCRAIDQVMRRDLAGARLVVDPGGCDAPILASATGNEIVPDVPGSKRFQLQVTRGRKPSDESILQVGFAYELWAKTPSADRDATLAPPTKAFVEHLRALIEADLKAEMRKSCRSLIVPIGAAGNEAFNRLPQEQQNEALRLHEQHWQQVADATVPRVEDATVGP